MPKCEKSLYVDPIKEKLPGIVALHQAAFAAAGVELKYATDVKAQNDETEGGRQEDLQAEEVRLLLLGDCRHLQQISELTTTRELKEVTWAADGHIPHTNKCTSTYLYSCSSS